MARVHIPACAHHVRGSGTYVRICSHVPTRCSALGRSARQNSARPYYLRFVSWLQTITHFPGSPRLSPSPSPPALYLSHSPSVCLFSFLFSGFLAPTPPAPNHPFYSPFRPSVLILPTSFSGPPPALFSALALRFPFMTVHRAQLRNGFIIKLPSGRNLILF